MWFIRRCSLSLAISIPFLSFSSSPQYFANLWTHFSSTSISLFLSNSYSCFFCFLNLEYTSNLLSSHSSTEIYFPLDANSLPTHFFFQKKRENYFPLCVFNSSKLIGYLIFTQKFFFEYLITAYPFVVVVVVVVVYL